MRGHDVQIRSLALSPDGQTLAVGGADTVWLWDTQNGEIRHKLLESRGDVIAFTPDGTRVATTGAPNTKEVRLWDVQTGEPKGTIKEQRGRLWGQLAFSPDGKLLASGHVVSDDGWNVRWSVKLWNTQTGDLLRTWGVLPPGVETV